MPLTSEQCRNRFQPQRTESRSVSILVRNLFEIMNEKKIHLTDAADHLGMTRVGIAYWKSGRTEPRVHDLEALASFAGISLVALSSWPLYVEE